MQKTKSLYNIVIENCTFNTRLFYYTKTDHIGIGSTFQYQKEYNENNRDPNSVIKGSDEYKIMVSCIKQNINIKDFNGFIRNQLYCSKFNNSCKESNRKKYNRLCFICNKSEIENNQKLSVHHIDMNKQQGCNSEWSLIPLCKSCHARCHNKLWEYRLKYLLNNI